MTGDPGTQGVRGGADECHEGERKHSNSGQKLQNSILSAGHVKSDLETQAAKTRREFKLTLEIQQEYKEYMMNFQAGVSRSKRRVQNPAMAALRNSHMPHDPGLPPTTLGMETGLQKSWQLGKPPLVRMLAILLRLLLWTKYQQISPITPIRMDHKPSNTN